MKRLKMGTATEVKRTLTRISNMILNNQIDPKRANALIYACNSALSSIRIDEQQAQIDRLEQTLTQLQNRT